jgi:hypothetical protein
MQGPGRNHLGAVVTIRYLVAVYRDERCCLLSRFCGIPV